VLTLPQSAVSFNPYGDSVFVVTEAVDGEGHNMLVAKSVLVTLGETRGDQVAILSGLEAGARVVTAGQLRLRNGSPVVIDDSIAPGNNPDPQVENN
jgi:membrane fusion protein (multidrug efflux system)